MKLVLQGEQADCGLACLVMAACHIGHSIDLAALRRRFGSSARGTSIGRLREIADAMHIDSRAFKLEPEALVRLRTPAILHWDLNHFVVLERTTRKHVHILDPACGRRRLSWRQVGKHFTGIALELTRSTTFRAIVDRGDVTPWSLLLSVQGVGAALIAACLFALGLQLLALTSPLFLQLVIDQAISQRDEALMFWLSIGFVAICLLQASLTMVKGWIITEAASLLGGEWPSRVFAHLTRLPAQFFLQRNLGDIASRFGSLQMIQQTLTANSADAVLSAALGSSVLVCLVLYAPYLAIAVVALAMIYAALRYFTYRYLHELADERLRLGAQQESFLLETLRGFTVLKLGTRLSGQRGRFSALAIALAQADKKSHRATFALSAFSLFILGGGRTLILMLAAHEVLRGRMSTGMLVAFAAYAEQVIAHAVTVADRCSEFLLLRVHAARVGDILGEAPEACADNAYSGPIESSSIELRNVSFRYSTQEPWVLRNFSVRIEAGESVAVVGPSGHGKSTLLKLMCGLLQPEEGFVLFGGVDIRSLGLDAYREMIGCVLQDDQLFTGTVADNISFFDAASALDDIVAAARGAAVHDDILRFPMGYETLVGDLGSTMSGGQKQRVVLARALYRKPRALLLDEATSHLDRDGEGAVNDTIKALRITRVVAAHRAETIASCDRVIHIDSRGISVGESSPEKVLPPVQHGHTGNKEEVNHVQLQRQRID